MMRIRIRNIQVTSNREDYEDLSDDDVNINIPEHMLVRVVIPYLI